MGDPAGIGPEIAVKALCRKDVARISNSIIIGDEKIIALEIKKYCPDHFTHIITSIDDCRFSEDVINVINVGIEGARTITYGEISTIAGDAAFRSVRKAIELALDGLIDAVVTGPIHKKAINDAGHHFSGHTEIFAHYTKTENYAMLLACDNLKVIHVTTHVSLSEACKLITRQKVLDKIRMLNDVLIKIGIKQPKIGVAGLNPHSGDEGLFGTEDEKEILPAIQQAISEGIKAEGPVPSDTLFPKALGGYFDGCVAMYHDQGHIPFKLAGFEWDKRKKTMKSVTGVNITLGLPFIRTSVDHGTAFDIAGKGIASENAMVEAIQYAVKLSKNNDLEL
ncbi:MAG: 4-hydroxythreonine-4-phosphate dehydrogenase PdxA [Bacteroidetes bacterium RBG_13_42_15]|nr:MAG: 4-hydroxythreonine-4-phosphate dehydrogenase PdxA [Bacteroidetes bacterium RBG_13_42_15]